MKFREINFNSVNSTNKKALKLIKKGKISPTIIIAKNQTRGRGQYKNKWISQKGNLFLTLFYEIKPNLDLKKRLKKNCKEIQTCLSRFTKSKITVKEPNDLIIDKKKFGGILHETIFYKKKKYLLIGIGINTIKSPKIINYPTTHLSKFCKKKINNNVIYKAIKNKFEKRIN